MEAFPRVGAGRSVVSLGSGKHGIFSPLLLRPSLLPAGLSRLPTGAVAGTRLVSRLLSVWRAPLMPRQWEGRRRGSDAPLLSGQVGMTAAQVTAAQITRSQVSRRQARNYCCLSWSGRQPRRHCRCQPDGSPSSPADADATRA